MYVCACVCMYVRMYIMYVRMYLHMYVCRSDNNSVSTQVEVEGEGPVLATMDPLRKCWERGTKWPKVCLFVNFVCMFV